jgi:hypothetical protein
MSSKRLNIFLAGRQLVQETSLNDLHVHLLLVPVSRDQHRRQQAAKENVVAWRSSFFRHA